MAARLTGLLLDTCAIIWLTAREPLLDPGRSAILAALNTGEVAVSPVSAWELGLIARLTRSAPLLAASPETVFETVLGLPGVHLEPLSYLSAIRSASLPPPFHNDPADRMLVATARDAGLTFVTRDRNVLDYAALGHVKALRC